ncbi:MAG: DUF61 family protein [Methanosarcinaceae archaeon]|nr:DUF61 family protein [Methanosarcinaceae archaeon]
MDAEDGGFKKLVQAMNRSLPERRRSLEELMKESEPSLKSRNGSIISIDKKELEMIAAIVPKYQWNRLMLPIIIEMTPDFGANAARIRGEVECSLVIKLLELKKSADKFIVLYMHEIKGFRRMLPTATQYGFYVSL